MLLIICFYVWIEINITQLNLNSLTDLRIQWLRKNQATVSITIRKSQTYDYIYDFGLFVNVGLTICGLHGTPQTAEVILVYKQTICYIGYRMERKAYLIEGQVELLIDHVTDEGRWMVIRGKFGPILTFQIKRNAWQPFYCFTCT